MVKRQPADATEYHTGCGGIVRLVHEVWQCQACGTQPVSVMETTYSKRRVKRARKGQP